MRSVGVSVVLKIDTVVPRPTAATCCLLQLLAFTTRSSSRAPKHRRDAANPNPTPPTPLVAFPRPRTLPSLSFPFISQRRRYPYRVSGVTSSSHSGGTPCVLGSITRSSYPCPWYYFPIPTQSTPSQPTMPMPMPMPISIPTQSQPNAIPSQPILLQSKPILHPYFPQISYPADRRPVLLRPNSDPRLPRYTYPTPAHSIPRFHSTPRHAINACASHG
ncbi:hypothetical protein K438DRAFT_1991976 [Mycena galopus ATCC 62051]|nr:hypothetical protein K438DRAFT_1991976 [Mycena galopus ATCC 62051]